MKRVDVFKDGKDLGYINNFRDSKWWFDEHHADSFELFDLNGFYDATYLKNDHVGRGGVVNYVKYIKEYYTKLTNKPLTSV